MSLVGKVMVFKGGSFSGHKRDFAAALAMAQFGVNVETSVTRATHILVCGSGVGAKTIEDAKKKGIQVWTANDFWENYQKPQYSATEKIVSASGGEPSVKDQAPGNDAAGSGASGRGRKQKATAEGVEKPAKKAVPRQPQQPSSKRQRVGLPPPPPRQTIDAGKLRLAARPSAWGVAKSRCV